MRIPYLGLRMNQQVATLPTRLNLGCGSFKKPGFLNVDIVPEVESDLILNCAYDGLDSHTLKSLLFPNPYF
jgi:hypothetical protein